MTILCVRLQLGPMYEAALPGLLGLLEEFTPVVEALPPDGALADLRGAGRYFGRDTAELATVIEVDGENVVPAVHAVLDKMADFAARVRGGTWTGLARASSRRARSRWT